MYEKWIMGGVVVAALLVIAYSMSVPTSAFYTPPKRPSIGDVMSGRFIRPVFLQTPRAPLPITHIRYPVNSTAEGKSNIRLGYTPTSAGEIVMTIEVGGASVVIPDIMPSKNTMTIPWTVRSGSGAVTSGSMIIAPFG